MITLKQINDWSVILDIHHETEGKIGTLGTEDWDIRIPYWVSVDDLAEILKVVNELRGDV